MDSVFYLIALLLLLTAAYSFFRQRIVLGVPALAFECAGLALLCSIYGFHHDVSAPIVTIAGCIVAMFFDPWIWKKVGPNGSLKFSILLNGGLLVLVCFSYAVGYWAS